MSRSDPTLSLPTADPATYRSGPSITPALSVELYRACAQGRTSPWWFSSDGSGRFDLVGVVDAVGQELGTCYLASDVVGALREVVAKSYKPGDVLSRSHFDERRVWSCAVVADLEHADLLDDRWGGLGVTNELFVCLYSLSHVWAATLWKAGFGALRVRLRHLLDPARFGVAYFGTAGAVVAATHFDAAVTAIDDVMVADFTDKTGIVVESPPTSLGHLHVLR